MKELFKAYKSSWANLWKFRFVIVLLYLLNYTFSFVLGAPFISGLSQNTSHSLYWSDTDPYNLYGILEYFNNYGDAYSILNGFMISAIILYIIMTVIMNAGILYAVLNRNSVIGFRGFFAGALHYFWKIFRLSLYFIIAICALFFFSWKILTLLGINVFDVFDDRELVLKFSIVLLISAAFFILIYNIKQYAKIYIGTDGRSFIAPSIFNALKFNARNILTVWIVFLVHFSLLLILFIVYYWLKEFVPGKSWFIIFGMSQLLLASKIIWRIVYVESIYAIIKLKESS